MVRAAHFAATVLACYLAARSLSAAGRASVLAWTWRSPRVAIVCWQGIGLALGLAAIGLPLSLGLAPYQRGVGAALLRLLADLARGGLAPGMTLGHLGLVLVGLAVAVGLLGATGRSLLGAVRARRRHRDLLTLLARDDPAAPGALVLDHPSAAAYCLPGVRPRVVVSAGTLDLLDPAQLAAVLSHERAHADERHDLVLLPFTALCRAVPRLGWVRAAHEAVTLLVEMRADDKARRLHADGPLAAALLRFATAGSRITPAGALGIAPDPARRPRPAISAGESPVGAGGVPSLPDRQLDARVRRLLVTGRPSRTREVLALAVAATLVSVPVSLFLT